MVILTPPVPPPIIVDVLELQLGLETDSLFVLIILDGNQLTYKLRSYHLYK